MNNEFYVRGVGGNELAIYNHDQLAQWNVFGTDNIGKIVKEEEDENKYYYLKDHLGSIRAVIDNENNVINAQDYDMWGFLLENRSFGGERYKFTSKERDDESSYDYFGARYYMSRIGRWGSVEPLMENYIDISPYVYSLNNPLIIIDPNGKDPYRQYLGSLTDVLNVLEENKDKTYYQLSDVFASSDVRFVYTKKGGFIDLVHFFYAAQIAYEFGLDAAILAGEFNELFQKLVGDRSANDPEDRRSNFLGAMFGVKYENMKDDVVKNLEENLTELNILDPLDEEISSVNRYIPYNKYSIPLPERYSSLPYHGEDPTYPEQYRSGEYEGEIIK